MEDTNKVNHLNALGWELRFNDTAMVLFNNALELLNQIKIIKQIQKQKFLSNIYSNIGSYHLLKGQYLQGLEYYQKALKLNEFMLQDAKNPSEKQAAQNGIAKRLFNIGLIYYNQADYLQANSYFHQSLNLFEELRDTIGIKAAFQLIGEVYYQHGDYPRALEYFIKNLKIEEYCSNKEGIASALTDIGNIYLDKEDYHKALEYYLKALKINDEIKNTRGMAFQLGNIGIVYKELRDYNSAIVYFMKALKIDENLENKNGIARHLGNIGGLYTEQAESEKKDSLNNKALNYYFRALSINDELGSKKGIAMQFNNIGITYSMMGKFEQAENYLKKSGSIFDSIGVIDGLRQNEEALTQLYDTTARYKLALIHYKKAMALKDTIFNQEKEKEINRKEMTYEFEKKAAVAKAEHEKQIAIVEAENKKQKIITYSVIVGLLLVLLFAGLIFRQLNITKKQKQIIEIKNKETEEQKLIIEEKNKSLEVAYDKIEEKNKEVTDSITYAKRIQQAMLPHRSEIWKALPQSFVLYKPKDIVAGDFYWFHKNSETVLIAAADCTGHGVPGAFTSMICSEKLNDAVKHSCDPGEILSLVNKGIKLSFKHTEETSSIITRVKDGMDIALCSIDLKNGIVKYAGAYRPLWIIRKNSKEIEEIKATKTAIGGDSPNDQMYKTHIIHLQQGDTIYLSSDGYADQDGGDKGKKLMTKTFKQMLIDIQDKPMKEQKEYLENFIEKWQADRHQLDDILVIGIRI